MAQEKGEGSRGGQKIRGGRKTETEDKETETEITPKTGRLQRLRVGRRDPAL